MALTSAVPLLTSGEIGTGFVVLFGFLYIAAWFINPPLTENRLYRRMVTGATAGVLAIQVVRLATGAHMAMLAMEFITLLLGAIEYIAADELVEVTPSAVRVRKRHLTESERRRLKQTIEVVRL